MPGFGLHDSGYPEHLAATARLASLLGTTTNPATAPASDSFGCRFPPPEWHISVQVSRTPSRCRACAEREVCHHTHTRQYPRTGLKSLDRGATPSIPGLLLNHLSPKYTRDRQSYGFTRAPILYLYSPFILALFPERARHVSDGEYAIRGGGPVSWMIRWSQPRVRRARLFACVLTRGLCSVRAASFASESPGNASVPWAARSGVGGESGSRCYIATQARVELRAKVMRPFLNHKLTQMSSSLFAKQGSGEITTRGVAVPSYYYLGGVTLLRTRKSAQA